MGDFRKSYVEFHKQKHGIEWTGNILDKFFLLDLKESMEQLFGIEKKINSEFYKNEITKEQQELEKS